MAWQYNTYVTITITITYITVTKSLAYIYYDNHTVKDVLAYTLHRAFTIKIYAMKKIN